MGTVYMMAWNWLMMWKSLLKLPLKLKLSLNDKRIGVNQSFYHLRVFSK